MDRCLVQGGRHRPAASWQGAYKELKCAELAKALESKTEFTQKEWDALGVHGLLRKDHFIKSSGGYFKPAIEASGGGLRADIVRGRANRGREQIVERRDASTQTGDTDAA